MAKDCISGITYYSLESEYPGDVTKNCGLTAGELDDNFHFLRGKEVVDLYWDDEKECFIIEKLDGSKIETESVEAYINASIEQILSGITQSLDNIDKEISGMSESIEGIYEEIDARVEEVKQEIKDASAQLNQRINDTKEEIISTYNAAIEHIEEEIADIRTQISGITNDINTFDANLRRAITELEDKTEIALSALNAKIDNKENELMHEINRVENLVTSGIGDATCAINSIQDSIDSMKLDIRSNTDRINEVESNANIAINGLSETTNRKIGILTNELLTTEDKLNRKIESGLTDVTENILELSAATISEFNDVIGEMHTADNELSRRIDEISGGTTGDISGLASKINTLSANTAQSFITTNQKIEDGDNELLEKINQLSADTRDEFVSENDRITNLSSATETSIDNEKNERIDSDRELNRKIDSLSGATANEINQINVSIDEINSDISALENNVNSAVTDINNDLLKVDNDITFIKSTISAITGDISELSGSTIVEYINVIVSGSTEVVNEAVTITGDDVEEY